MKAEDASRSGSSGSTAATLATTWLPLVLAVTLCIGFLVGELWFLDGELGLPLDDSWIHLQFARNLARGEGLTYNPGEVVPGTTAPLWTALLSLVFFLPGSPLLWAKVFGSLLFVAGIDATRRLALELGLTPVLAAFAAAVTAGTGWLLWSALSGMEIPLFVCLSVWGIILHVRERRQPSRPPLSAFILAAAVLARPEGLLLVTLAVADRLLVTSRDDDGTLRLERPSPGPALWALVAAAMLVLPVSIFNLVHGGSALPTTFAAKSTGLERLLPDLLSLYQTFGILMSERPIFSFTAVAGCLLLWQRLGGRRDAGLLPALWLVGLPLAYTTLGGVQQHVLAGNFGRYFFPLFPLVVVLGLLGIDPALRASGRLVRAGGLRIPLGLILAVFIVWPTARGTYRGLGRFLQSVGNVQDSDVAMARWLGERLSPEALLAVNDVGAIKFLLPNRIVDLAGIIDPEIPIYMREARDAGRNWHDGVLRFLEETRPDYLVIFPGWYPRIGEEKDRFPLRYSLKIPQNITMGGDELAVHATPWTRYPLAGIDQEEGQ